MFKYRLACTNEEDARLAIRQHMLRDFPIGKGFWGIPLYDEGLHFRVCGETVKGFHLSDREGDSSKGEPMRVCFTGRFVQEEDQLFFDVYIYPRLFSAVILLGLAVDFTVFGGVVGALLATVALLFFGKSYYDDIRQTHRRLQWLMR